MIVKQSLWKMQLHSSTSTEPRFLPLLKLSTSISPPSPSRFFSLLNTSAAATAVAPLAAARNPLSSLSINSTLPSPQQLQTSKSSSASFKSSTLSSFHANLTRREGIQFTLRNFHSDSSFKGHSQGGNGSGSGNDSSGRFEWSERRTGISLGLGLTFGLVTLQFYNSFKGGEDDSSSVKQLGMLRCDEPPSKPAGLLEDEEGPDGENGEVGTTSSTLPSSAGGRQLTSLELLSQIWRHLRKSFGLLFAIVLVTLAAAGVNIYTPVVIGRLVGILQAFTVTSTGTGVTTTATSGAMTISALNKFGFHLLLLFVAQGFLTFLDTYLVTRLGERLSGSIRGDLFRAILIQDLEFFDARMAGEITSRLSQDLADFKHTFKQLLTQGLKCLVQVVGSIIQLFTISPFLSLRLGTTLPLLYLFMNLYGSYLRSLSQNSKFADSQSTSQSLEVVSNIRTVKSFVTEEQEVSRYVETSAHASRLSSLLGWHIGAFQGINNTVIGCMVLGILWIGGNQVANNQMTGGELMTYLVATQNTQRSLSSLGLLFSHSLKAFASASRVFEYICIVTPKIPSSGGLYPSSPFKGEIKFEGVSFRYPTRPDQLVLDKFDLQVPKGSVVALCGSSGSGKSTIGQLIERFYDPESGRILVDGLNLSQVDPRWVRRNIGYISQDPALFACSIRENIRYASPEATDLEVEHAAQQANAHDFIMKFPGGYNTIVGERGATLSGGQKQRISIARALLKSPLVLILDEATSALDTASERAVQEALDRLMTGRTSIVIAHRLSTIQNANKIVVMQGLTPSSSSSSYNNLQVTSGKVFPPLSKNVLEEGTHDELIKRKGAYWRLYQSMSLAT